MAMLLHSKPPYNFCGQEEKALEDCKVAVLPVPYDATTSYRAGARDGPQAMISASRNMELYDLELQCDISEKLGIYTLPELEPSTHSPERTVERVEQAFDDIQEKGKFPVMFGGEHSITTGAVRSLFKKHPKMCVLQIDAHGDMRDEYEDSKFNHACVMRRVREICPAVSVGIRSMCAEEVEHVKKTKPKIFYARSFDVREVLKNLGDEVYITVDLDGFDPSVVPATGTPEPDGLLWEEVAGLVKEVCMRKKVIGFDIVELMPIPGNIVSDFVAAKLAYKMMGYAFRLGK
jgi:agmatinase